MHKMTNKFKCNPYSLKKKALNIIKSIKLHLYWLICTFFCIVFSWTVSLCIQIPSALSTVTASWTSAPQALRSTSPRNLSRPSEHKLSPFCFGILLHPMIRISVCSDRYASVLRPRLIYGHRWNICTYIVRTVMCTALWFKTIYLLWWPEPAGMACRLFVCSLVDFRPCNERCQGGSMG